MKKLIILALIAFAQVSYTAELAKDAAKPLTLEQARRANQQRQEIKNYLEALKTGKMTAQIKQSLIKLISDSTATIGGIDSSNIELLAATRPEILDKVTQLMSLAKSGSIAEKEKASADLRILSEAAKYEMTKDTVEVLEKITEMADYNESAKQFKVELAKTLRLGKAKSIEEAVKIASNGKITLEKIKECII